MRKVAPERGEKRVVKRFALFPITCGKETRWFETVYIVQEAHVGLGEHWWENVKFVERGVYLAFQYEARLKKQEF